MTERPQGIMTDELARQWIEWIKMDNDDGDFYETQVGKALEADDPVARDFLQRAKRLDPGFVSSYYPGFLE
jgi:hypothetical protein